MTPPLETERLFLRPLDLADAAQIQELFSQWEVVRYLANVVPWPYPADGAMVHIRDSALPAMERGEAWQWTLRLKAAPEIIIGSITLMLKPGNNRGFWLAPQHRGSGLMTEASERVLEFWFDVLEQPVLQVPKAAPNLPSRRISEKNGMRVVATEERDYVSGRFVTEIWEITLAEWRSRQAHCAKQ